MNLENWFTKRLESYEDDFEYRLERQILEITEQIASLMEESGITRAQLATKLGCSRAAITKIFKGTPNITLKRLLSIADALGRELEVSLPPKGFKNPGLFVSKLESKRRERPEEYVEEITLDQETPLKKQVA